MVSNRISIRVVCYQWYTLGHSKIILVSHHKFCFIWYIKLKRTRSVMQWTRNNLIIINKFLTTKVWILVTKNIFPDSFYPLHNKISSLVIFFIAWWWETNFSFLIWVALWYNKVNIIYIYDIYTLSWVMMISHFVSVSK